LHEGRRGAAGQWTVPDPTAFHNEAATQTQRCFDLVNLDPFRYDSPSQIAAWVAHLAGIEQQLWLLNA